MGSSFLSIRSGGDIYFEKNHINIRGSLFIVSFFKDVNVHDNEGYVTRVQIESVGDETEGDANVTKNDLVFGNSEDLIIKANLGDVYVELNAFPNVNTINIDSSMGQCTSRFNTPAIVNDMDFDPANGLACQ